MACTCSWVRKRLGFPTTRGRGTPSATFFHQASVSDCGCECKGQHPMRGANRRGRQALVCEAVDPTRDIRVGDPGQGFELPSRQDLPTHCDLVADHHGRLQLDLTREPLRQLFSDRDLGEGSSTHRERWRPPAMPASARRRACARSAWRARDGLRRDSVPATSRQGFAGCYRP
jgi:hypothetical protein